MGVNRVTTAAGQTAASLEPTAAGGLGREFPFTDRDFECLREFVAKASGIRLSEAKRELLYSRLTRRLRALGLKSFAEYCALLRADESGAELENLVNAVTTNLTAFFRERHHFDYLRESLLPTLVRARAASRRLRLWSAGCSTGAEPYSLAMTVSAVLPPEHGWDVQILATDIDSEVLARAAEGIYALNEIEAVPPEWRRRWWLRGKGSKAGYARIKDELRALVHFRRHNLLEFPWPMKGPFDIVFCRNVVIYFDKADQRRVFDGFAEMLAPDGHLFIGHAETLYKVCDRFEPLGQTIYRKKS